MFIFVPHTLPVKYIAVWSSEVARSITYSPSVLPIHNQLLTLHEPTQKHMEKNRGTAFPLFLDHVWKDGMTVYWRKTQQCEGWRSVWAMGLCSGFLFTSCILSGEGFSTHNKIEKSARSKSKRTTRWHCSIVDCWQISFDYLLLNYFYLHLW